jgi:hypothetical protein
MSSTPSELAQRPADNPRKSSHFRSAPWELFCRMDAWFDQPLCISAVGSGRHSAPGSGESTRQIRPRVATVAGKLNHSKKLRVPGRNGGFRVVDEDGVSDLRIERPAHQRNSVERIWTMAAFGWRLGGIYQLQMVDAPEIIIESILHLFGAFESYRLAKRLRTFWILEVNRQKVVQQAKHSGSNIKANLADDEESLLGGAYHAIP